MFVADSESNIIRAVALPPKNAVRTIAGGDLFEFGDRDGRGDAARFQHPLGVAFHGSRLIVADTYNHCLRTVDPETGDVVRLAGAAEAGFDDGPADTARFYEPGGVSTASDRVYVADTNNHAVRVVSFEAHGPMVRTVNVRQ